jgi:hypothetical protein
MENIDTRFIPGKSVNFSANSGPVPGVQFQQKLQQETTTLREILQSNIKRPQVSQEFIQSIKDKIRLA